jgi:thioesterase domain-containing protein
LAEKNYFPLITLHCGKQKLPPLFCLPGAGAGVTTFTELTDCLGDGRPIYGLQPRGLEEQRIPHSTVKAAAAFYWQAINEMYSSGSVHLLGHSFGGWVAFEMAQMFAQTEGRVGSLTILDSEAPDQGLREYNDTEVTMKWLETLELILGRPLNTDRSRIDVLRGPGRRKLLHQLLIREGLMPERSDPETLRGPLRTYAASIRVHYRPSTPYMGPTRLVLVEDSGPRPVDSQQDQRQVVEEWKRWAPNLVCTQVPGNHLTVLKRPYVSSLANIVREQLSSGCAISQIAHV